MDMVLKPHAPIVNLYILFHFRSIRVRTRNWVRFLCSPALGMRRGWRRNGNAHSPFPPVDWYINPNVKQALRVLFCASISPIGISPPPTTTHRTCIPSLFHCRPPRAEDRCLLQTQPDRMSHSTLCTHLSSHPKRRRVSGLTINRSIAEESLINLCPIPRLSVLFMARSLFYRSTTRGHPEHQQPQYWSFTTTGRE